MEFALLRRKFYRFSMAFLLASSFFISAVAQAVEKLSGGIQVSDKSAMTGIPVGNGSATDMPDVFKYKTDPKKGWYWYEVEKEEKKDEKQDVKDEYPSRPVDPWTMDADEFKKNLEEIRKEAIRNPTIENVKNYIALQDVARKKSVAFAHVYTLVLQKYPQYTTAGDYPSALPGSDALYKMRQTEVSSLISENKENFAMVYFFRVDCPFCAAQSNILKYFIDKYGWEVRPVDIARNPELAYRFNVTTVPFILVVSRISNDYMPVAVGVASLSELERNVYRGVRYLIGEVTPMQFDLYEFQKGGPGDPDNRLDMPPDAPFSESQILR